MRNLFLFALLFNGFIAFGQNSPATDTIPIEIWNGSIVIKANVDGNYGDFIWDNGFAPYSGIDTKVFSELKLKKDQFKAVDGNNKVVTLRVGMAKEVLLDNIKLSNISFLEVDMSASKTHTKTPLGYIGMSVIKKYNWDFHFDENYVVVSDKPFDKIGEKLNLLTDKHDGYYFNLIVNAKPVQFNIDFGDNTEKIKMPKTDLSLFRKYQITDTSLGIAALGIGGLGNVDSLFTIKDVPCEFEKGQNKNFKQSFVFSSNPVYRVGNNFFRNFNCIINAASKKKNIILYNRKADSASKHFPYQIAVVLLNDTMRIIQIHHINALVQGSVKLMDVVSSINGCTKQYFLSPLDLFEYQYGLSENKKPMIIKMMNGKEYTFYPEEN